MIISALDATSFGKGIRGLIGKNTAEPMLLKTRFGIHTFFLAFPIDVVVIDKKNIVKTIKQNMQPNRIFVWNPKWKHVLELPAGTVEKEKLKLGEKITLRY